MIGELCLTDIRIHWNTITNPILVAIMIWDMLPLTSFAFAGVAALHSISLFALRVPANDVDSVHVALTGLVMDCMAVPMAYFIPKYGFHPVRLSIE